MIYRYCFAMLLSFAVLAPGAAQVAPIAPVSATILPTTPKAKPDGKKWRLAYVGSGDYAAPITNGPNSVGRTPRRAITAFMPSRCRCS